MTGRTCCVQSCRRRSHDHRGRKIPNGLTFHCFPAWRRGEGEPVSALTYRRRKAWVSAVNRSDISFNHIPTSMRVCSRHFISGKPAYEVLESDPDWLPSLYLGQSKSSGKQGKLRPLTLQEEKERKIERKKKKKERREAAAVETNCSDSAAHTDVRRPVVPPWKHVKPLLQAVLQKKPDTSLQQQQQQPAEETQPQQQPAEETQQSSFRDFFSKALDAALDESSRSRTRSSRQFLPQNEEDTCADPSSSSSSCLKCVSLQRRVEELEESLLQNPNHLAPIEKETPEWMQPISSPDIEDNSDDEDSPPHVSLDSPPHVSLDSPPHISLDSPPRRKVHRFNTAWLTRFPFLRYCPVQDMMWCHVCRLYADKTHNHLALIRGSRMFKAYNIRIHSNCNFHRKNTKLYKSRNLLL